MIQYFFTKEKEWLEKWDLFIKNNPHGNHLMLSDWLKSYDSYGFDYELGLLLDNNKIVGGCSVIIPKFLFFKFYIIPHGPCYKKGFENYMKTHLLELKKRAKSIGSCYMQLSMPISDNEKILQHVYEPDYLELLNNLFKPGKLFKYVYSSYGLNWIDFKGFISPEVFLEQLTPKVRRNIRMPYNKKAVASFVTDAESIEKGYQVIIENAKYGNYKVRLFKEFKDTIFELINKKQAYFVICKVEGQIKAAGFFVETSGYITNIMGGVLREKPDIKLGYMLQWEIIKKSFEQNFSGYNISMGGSSGVQDFKEKFGTQTINYDSPHYYEIINPFLFNLFKFFDKYLKPYKAQISHLLTRIKR